MINPGHLQPRAIERVRDMMRVDEFGSVIIDDFLRPALASGLLACFERDGEFKEHHSLKQAMNEDEPGFEEHVVSGHEFNDASEARWLAREMLMVEPPSANAESEGWQAHVKFMKMIGSAEFKAYLAAVSDTEDLNDITYMARTMRHGDLCRAHSDAGDGRALCMLLYIGDGWRPGHGGRFQNVDGCKVLRSTDPLGNRVILHKPALNEIHQVEPLSDLGRSWKRHTYSIWFGVFPESY